LRLVNEAIKGIRAELKAAKLALNSAKAVQKKFTAMEKQLDRFERDWVKAAKPKRKTRRRTRKAAATGTDVPSTEEAKVEAPESEKSEQGVS
jgi:hypothetical protein